MTIYYQIIPSQGEECMSSIPNLEMMLEQIRGSALVKTSTI